jgi:hypothetical protein
MRLIFKPWTNTFARVSAVLGPALAGGALLGLWIYVRTPYFTQQHVEVVQPVQFDHRHHVADIGIDCRYCHQTVEKSASAGYPPTQVCLNCHSQVWNKSPLLDLVRQSYFTDTPIPWKRVHRLPDFVYFNHSIHVNKGVGCETCHGRIDKMAAVEQENDLTMGWCLNCHRSPEEFLRPKDQVTTMGYEPMKDGKAVAQLDLGRELIHQNAVRTRTACTACHR